MDAICNKVFVDGWDLAPPSGTPYVRIKGDAKPEMIMGILAEIPDVIIPDVSFDFDDEDRTCFGLELVANNNGMFCMILDAEDEWHKVVMKKVQLNGSVLGEIYEQIILYQDDEDDE